MLLLDVGGTKIAYTRDFSEVRRVPTPKTYEEFVSTILSLAEGEKAIGMAIAGICYEGEVVFNPNMPFLVGKNLRDILASQGFSVVIENDANAAAMGEFVYGAGKGWESLLYITISTGIGGGFAYRCNGKPMLWKGLGGALEIGHTIISEKGHWESLASGKAFERRAKEKGLSIEEAWRDKALVEEELGYVAIGIRNAIYAFHPEGIVLGGGVMKGLSKHMNSLLSKLKSLLDKQYLTRMPKIVRETLSYPALYGMKALLERDKGL